MIAIIRVRFDLFDLFNFTVFIFNLYSISHVRDKYHG